MSCINGRAYSGMRGKTTEKKDEKKENAETLEVWLPAKLNGEDEAVWNEIAEPFEEKHHVDVNFQFISWKDYEAKYSSAISTGTGPDVGYMYVEMFPTYIDAGAVEALDSYLTDEDYENYTVLGDQYKIFGKNYGIAQGRPEAVLTMFYNKDILASIGEKEPETWEDVIRISKKATLDTDGDGTIDQYGIAQGWGQTFYQDLNWNWYSFLYQSGGEIFDDEEKCILDSKEAIETAQFLYDLKNTENVLPEDTMSLQNSEAFEKYFLQGKAAIGFTGGGSSTFNQLSEGGFDFGFTYELEGTNGEKGVRASVDQFNESSGRAIAETLISQKPYPLKVAYVQGGNPAMIWENREKLVPAFLNLDFMVVSDFYMTPTAMLADIVLPAAVYMEYESVVIDHNENIYYSPNLVLDAAAKSDLEIINEIGKAMGYKNEFWETMEDYWNDFLNVYHLTIEEVREQGDYL